MQAGGRLASPADGGWYPAIPVEVDQTVPSPK
ncbi:MAG: hypothetical protein QOJ19_995 [Acidimicrobiia bacterium]|nr:hypothetical protein [Acidimicrobiia bacterium]